MAALLKLNNALRQDACKAADNDGLLVNLLQEALTGANRLNVGAYGRSAYSPVNYATAGQSIDQHLTGINNALTISGLGDTTITSPADAALLIYDTGTAKWRDAAMTGDATITDAGVLTVATVGGLTPLFTNTDFGGDVSGIFSAIVVTNDSHSHTASTLTLGSIKTLNDVLSSMTPSDGQVLTYDTTNGWQAETHAAGATTFAALNDTNISSPQAYQVPQWDGTDSWDNKYPGMANAPGTQTFIILSNSATTGEINTALSNYDIVYLKAGTHTATANISIPDGKTLSGVRWWHNTTGGTVINLGTGYKINIGSSNCGTLKNMVVSGGVRTTHFTTCVGAIVQNVTFTSTAYAYYFLYGTFRLIDHVYTIGLGGVLVTTAAPNAQKTFIRDSYFEMSGQTGATYYGVHVVSGATETFISNCYASNGYRGFYLAAPRCSITNCRTYSMSNAGFYTVSTGQSVQISNCESRDDYDAFYLHGDYSTVTGCNAYNPTHWGFYFNSIIGSSFSGLSVYSSGNYAFYLNGVYRCSFSSLTTVDSGSYGVYGLTVQDSTFAAITSYNSASTGIKFGTSCTRSSISGAASYSSGSRGIVFEGSYWTATGLTAVSNTGYGVWILCSYSSVGTITSFNNSSYGVYGGTTADYTAVHDISARGNTTYDCYFPAIGAQTSHLDGVLNQSGKDWFHTDWIYQNTAVN